MDNTTSELPVFATEAPPVFRDADSTIALFGAVLDQLTAVVEVGDEQRSGPTPCAGFTVAELQRHTLAWLQFFAAALTDPSGELERIDPETWQLGTADPKVVVAQARADIIAAVERGAADQMVVMSQAKMSGDGVLAMALGEYLIHGWDLATATGQAWSAAEGAPEPALAFLRTTVAPEYRGPDTGFFDVEVEAPADATAMEQLLCFAGRTPTWTPAA